MEFQPRAVAEIRWNIGDSESSRWVPGRVLVAPTSGACPSPLVGPGTSGTYCAPPYVTATLTYDSVTSTYTFITHPYEAYKFDSSGNFLSDTTSDGATLSESYGSPSPGTGLCPSSATSCDTVTAASGRQLILGLSTAGRIITVTDPRGNTWTYSYTNGDLTSVTDPMDRVTSYSYDTTNSTSDLRHDLLTVTAPNGQSGGPDAGANLQNTYNSSGQVTGQTDPGGWTTSIDYSGMDLSDGDGSTLVTDPDGYQTSFTYVTGVLESKSVGPYDPVQSVTVFDPSTTTLLDTSVIDPEGGTTSYTYDTDGNVLTTTMPDGSTATDSYDALDEVVCSTTAMASYPCSSLSPPSAVTPGTSISPPSSAPPPFTTYTQFDNEGHELWQTTGIYGPGDTVSFSSRTTYNLYDGTSVSLGGATDSCSSTSPFESLPCATIDANGNVTQLSYDSVGDAISTAIPDGNGSELATTTDSYDANGNETSATSPQGNLSGAERGQLHHDDDLRCRQRAHDCDSGRWHWCNGNAHGDGDVLRLQWQRHCHYRCLRRSLQLVESLGL